MEKKYNEIIRVLKREIHKLEETIANMQYRFLACEDTKIEVSYEQRQELKDLMRKGNIYIEALICTVRKRNELQDKGSKKHEKRQYTIRKYIRER